MTKTESFEKYSTEYDEWFDRHAGLYKAELAAIKQLMPPAGAEGLEVGVGSGRFAVPLGIKTGVEPSGKMACKARLRGVDVHPGVAEALPFADGRFDFVLMVTTICFVDDVKKSLAEAFRVLKPGGCIIIGFVDKESELGKLYSGKKENSKFYKDATFFSVLEVQKDLDDSGFLVTDVLQTLIPGKSPHTILEGSGKGAFVGIKGTKIQPDQQA